MLTNRHPFPLPHSPPYCTPHRPTPNSIILLKLSTSRLTLLPVFNSAIEYSTEPLRSNQIYYSYISANSPPRGWLVGWLVGLDMSVNNSHDEPEEKVVLVVGACCLDRLLAVTSYPQADAKIRTTAYHELAGGNAGNTATAMALLQNAAFLSGTNNNNNNNNNSGRIKIKILTKVGDDSVGLKLVQDLAKAGVDLSSPLFQVKIGSTTSSTTIVVSNTENTRTCFHTPGSCGELTIEGFEAASLDELFENVVLLSSDGRHTSVANALAKEARKRGIPVAVDPEKDRQREEQDELMVLATTLLTNSDQMDKYFDRRRRELAGQNEGESLLKPVISLSTENTNSSTQILANAIDPSSFYLRWHGDTQLHKEVVLTKGKLGAIRVTSKKMEATKNSPGEPTILVRDDAYPVVINYTDAGEGVTSQFEVETTGVVHDVNVIDTTGAGDAFIGGYLLCKLVFPSSSQLALQFGTWVAGKKLEGPGAQSTLPMGIDVDNILGNTKEEVQQSLNALIGPFGCCENTQP